MKDYFDDEKYESYFLNDPNKDTVASWFDEKALIK